MNLFDNIFSEGKNIINKCLCRIKYLKRCPPSVSQNNEPECKRFRERLADASPLILPDKKQFIFINKLSGFDETICKNGRYTTLEQLSEFINIIRKCGFKLCPMLVWTTKDDVPILAEIKPGFKDPVKPVITPFRFYLAYSIFILSEEPWLTLEPGETYKITSSSPYVQSITFTAKIKGTAYGNVCGFVQDKMLNYATITSPSPVNYAIDFNRPYPVSSVILKNQGEGTVYLRIIYMQ